MNYIPSMKFRESMIKAYQNYLKKRKLKTRIQNQTIKIIKKSI